jgi:flavin-dependent dehydrogenase
MYDRLVRQHPRIWRRLQKAQLVTGVRGMRKIGNLYRQAGGPGWALVGDAVHQKDPLDGQGIFDAVFTAKALAQAIGAWKRGEQTWEQAIAGYEDAVRAETYPMYQRTLERVRTEVYGKVSERAFKTYLRWILEDQEYKRRVGLMVVRGIDPRRWLPARVILVAMLRGAAADLKRNVAARVMPLRLFRAGS